MQPHQAIQVFDPPDEISPRYRVRAGLVAVLSVLAFSGHPLASDTKVPAAEPRPDTGVVAMLRRDSAFYTLSGRALAAPASLTDTLAGSGLAPKAAPFVYSGTSTDLGRAVECLAMAAWYEAGDNAEDQKSVMQVVLNRVAHPAYPNTVCGVVFQGSGLPTGCQFTFTCDGSMQKRKALPAAMTRARSRALAALEGETYAPVAQATHYHADYVTPWWSPSLQQLAKVGRHIFYRMPGKGGVLPGRQGSAGGEQDLAVLLAASYRPGAILPGADASVSGETTPRIEAAMVPVHTVATTPVSSSTIFMRLDKAQPNGRWALAALDKCKGQSGCQVVGYGEVGQVASNRALPSRERERPLFLYLRDGSSGIDMAMWDCQRVDRPNSSQCLPDAGPQLDRLMRDRSE